MFSLCLRKFSEFYERYGLGGVKNLWLIQSPVPKNRTFFKNVQQYGDDPVQRNGQIAQSCHKPPLVLSKHLGPCANWCAFAV